MLNLAITESSISIKVNIGRHGILISAISDFGTSADKQAASPVQFILE
jgi:hypothetical protein